MTKSNENVFDLYMTEKAKFDAMLDQLKAQSDDFFGMAPQEVGWGALSDLKRAIIAIKEIQL